jgi:hypothetical protein
MPAQIGILNVGAGDTKLVFDKSNPAECIRSARIVKDMLRRGYALLIEVDDGKGGKIHTRARDFDEAVCEYIIADFDPETAAQADKAENERLQQKAAAESPGQGNSEESPPEGPAPKRKRYIPEKRVSAHNVGGVAVARSAGG